MEKERVKVEQHGGLGLLWFAGWLFTIGYLELSFWRAILAIVLWPYYIGQDLGVPDVAAPASATQ